MSSRNPPADALSRRRFLGLTGIVPAVLLAQSAAPRAFATFEEPVKSPAQYPLGLELYSVREALAKDLTGTLREVARIGYEVVEFYAPYFEWTVPYAKEVRRQMDDLGLRCYSTHNHMESFAPGEGIGKAIELNQILGTRHLVLASAGREGRSLETWKKLCDQLTTAVGQLQPHGLTAGFHNHQTEWSKIDGEKRIMDVIAANTPREFVLQLDVGTCVEAGADPVAWIKANPGRIRSLHLKDWAPGPATEEKGYRVLFGEGVCPWTDVIATAQSVGGLEFFLMEQEGSRFSEFETAQRCLANWRGLTRKS